MLQATSGHGSSQGGAGALVPAPVLTKSSAHSEQQQEEKHEEEEEQMSIWQPAAPRLRLFSPATPRPGSAAPTPNRHNYLGTPPQASLSPTLRPSSAFCGKLTLPSDHERDRLVMVAAVTSPGAAGPTTPAPSRTSQILNKVHALQARAAAAAAHPPALAFAAPPPGPNAATVAAVAVPPLPGPLVLCDSPPGSPLMVVRSVTRTPRPAPPSANSANAENATSPSSPPVGADHCRPSSMPPDSALRMTSSGSAVPLTTGTMTPRRMAIACLSGEADTAAATAALAVGTASHPNSPLGNYFRSSTEAQRRTTGTRKPSGLCGGNARGLSGEYGDGGGMQSNSEVGNGCNNNGAAGTATEHRLPTVFSGHGSAFISEGSGKNSASRGCTITGDGACGAVEADIYNDPTASGGGGGGGNGDGESGCFESRRGNSAMTAGSSGFPGRSIASSYVPSMSAAPSSSPVTWPQDDSHHAIQADGSPVCGSPASSGFLPFFNHQPKNHNSTNNHSEHSAPLQHLSLQLEPRSSLPGTGSCRISPAFSSPVRPSSSAALLIASRSLRPRPRSCSSNGAPGATNGSAAIAISGLRAPAVSSGGVVSGSAVAAVAAAAPQSTLYEIMPDHPSRQAAVTASVPPGSRVARAIVGILPSGNPGTFNLRLDERIDKVLNEGVTIKSPRPKSPPQQPHNPTVIKMLQERHEAEAQRTVVDSAFSSGNPAAWMHQIMAESGSGAPPWAQPRSPSQQSQSQRQQQGQGRQGGAASTQSPRHIRPGQHQQQPSLQPQAPPGGMVLGSARQQPRPASQHYSYTQPHQHIQQQQSQASAGTRGAAFGAAQSAWGTGAGAAAASQQRMSGALLGPGVPRHTSAETLHLQSMSYLASKEACRTLAADSRPAVSINLREVFEGPLGGTCVPGSPTRSASASRGVIRSQKK